MPTVLELLPRQFSAAGLLALALDRATRRPHASLIHAAAASASFRLREAVAYWPEHGASRERQTGPRFLVHGRGSFDCNVVVLKLPREQVIRLLPKNCELASPKAEGSHPLLLFFGRQIDVRPNIWPLPGISYHESVVAVPDVRVPDPAYAYQGPFVFLPRLWLDKLPPVLAGVLFYGYPKILARIWEDRGSYQVSGIGDSAMLAELRYSRAGVTDKPFRFPAWNAIETWFDQPILTEPAPGVEIGSVLNFRTHRITAVEPLNAEVRFADNAVPGFAGGSFRAEGLNGFPAAFRMRSRWEITPPLPRSWFDIGDPAVAHRDHGHDGRNSARPKASAAGEDITWTRPPKQKIAVLGGGVGALTAAWALTEQPDWRERFDITVYQMGWRLGGKCASGRNAAASQRIEEHGLHVWAGFYENAFRVMRSCYRELARTPGTPLATIDDAFEPQSRVTLEDKTRNGWSSWNIDTLRNSGVPGVGEPMLPSAPIGYLPALFDWLTGLLPDAPASMQRAYRDHPVRYVPHVRAAVFAARVSGHHPLVLEAEVAAGPAPARRTAGTVLHDATAIAQHAASSHAHRPLQLAALLHTVKRLQDDRTLQFELQSSDQSIRRFAELFDLAFATIAGMIEDRLVFRGFEAADGEEWRVWLARHGARPGTLQSPTVRATYDYVFGFIDGDTTRGSLAAGTTTHGMLRLTLTYKGAFFWMMRAGMGDTVFTPLYQVLLRRGVNFAFFHKVEALRLGPGGCHIGHIALRRQVAVSGDYDPLVTVSDLACWPAEPRWAQIVGGEQLQQAGIDLEDEAGTTGEPLTLIGGRDFDAVILGLSLGSLPATCRELIGASPRWRAMVEGMRTVPTMGVQLWFEPDLAGLGWPAGPTIATAYAEPLDTWADMSRLIERETWPEPGPKSIVYLCGALPEDAATGTKAAATEQVKSLARQWLATNSGQPWPAASNSGALDCQRLHRNGGGSDEERFAAQYFRANASGSERYVQSVPGSTELRIRPDESGFDNLYLAGDWVRTGLNAGCVEAATMGGLAAAAAISGRRIDVVGGEEKPLATTLIEQMLGGVCGISHVEAAVVVASLPQELGRTLLPPGLALGAHSLTAAGRFPLVMIFARQRQARFSLSPWGTNYHEVIMLVPGVREVQPTVTGGPRLFGYLPRLYVDNLQMLVVGRLGYGYPKAPARIHLSPGSAEVHSYFDGRPIITAEFRSRGAAIPAALSAHYDDIAWLFDRPILSRAPFGGWRSSAYEFALDDATVEGLDVSLTFHPAMRPSLATRPLMLRTGQDDVISAFRLWADSRLSNPLIGLRQTRAAGAVRRPGEAVA